MRLMLLSLIMMSKPYTDIEITDKYIIREFNENIDPIELMWHRDDENRLVEIIDLPQFYYEEELIEWLENKWAVHERLQQGT